MKKKPATVKEAAAKKKPSAKKKPATKKKPASKKNPAQKKKLPVKRKPVAASRPAAAEKTAAKKPPVAEKKRPAVGRKPAAAIAPAEKNTTSEKDQKIALLGKSSLFAQLSPEELGTIARYSGYRSYSTGQVIFEEGSHREELYLIKEGTVAIRRHAEDDGDKEIAQFVGGEVFGEMDLLDTAPRSASAVAEGPATLLVFPDGLEFSGLLEKHPDVFARVLRKLLGEIAGRIRAIDKLISEKTPWIEELKKQLLRDRLTGLYNRAFLEEELPQIVAAHSRTSLLVVKPDNFKVINDTYGHEAGDKTLMLLAEAVKSRLKDGDMGARFRGDEYCVILPGRSARDTADAAEALRAAVRAIDLRPVTGSDAVSLTGSVGASAHPAPAADAKTLVGRAFEKMWEARNEGGDRVRVEGDA
jgi:diguanylate cyclase